MILKIEEKERKEKEHECGVLDNYLQITICSNLQNGEK